QSLENTPQTSAPLASGAMAPRPARAHDDRRLHRAAVSPAIAAAPSGTRSGTRLPVRKPACDSTLASFIVGGAALRRLDVVPSLRDATDVDRPRAVSLAIGV